MSNLLTTCPDIGIFSLLLDEILSYQLNWYLKKKSTREVTS
ncbi:MAG: hypothetical protein ACXAEU_02660 [Candidatus Hodarchaeales archaeon]